MKWQVKFQRRSPQSSRNRKSRYRSYSSHCGAPVCHQGAALSAEQRGSRQGARQAGDMPLMAPAPSTAPGRLHRFYRWYSRVQSPVWRLPLSPRHEHHWLTLSLWSRFFSGKLLPCYFFPIPSLRRRLILPQSRSLLSSLLNWTLFFSFQTISQVV